jgi:hypothetical protein
METEVKDVNKNLTSNADEADDEAIQTFENDPDVQRLKAHEAELTNMLSLISDPKVMKAYRAIRSDVYGVGERRQVSQKEKKKKKAKRRMTKKSKR